MPRLISVVRANSREALTSLRAARLRTVLGLLGIMIGISSVIAMISLGEIVKLQARKQFSAIGANVLIIRKSSDEAPAQGKEVEIGLADAREMAHSVPSITDAAARISGHGQFRYAGKDIGRGDIQGVTESFARVNRLSMQSGRFISDLDIGRQFCVVGETIAMAMRETGATEIEGSLIELEDDLCTVIGALAYTPENYALPVNIAANASVFIPVSTASRLISPPEIDVIIARSRDDVRHERVADEVRDYFRGRNPDLGVDVVSARQLIMQMESQQQLFTLLLAAIGSISLVVGGIGIMNIMLVSVTERRREIAIRRALGARRGDIQSQFLIESVILTMTGGALGVALGLVATYVICQFTGWDFSISSLSVVSGFGIAALAGLFFGFQPAWQAARLDPIAGLQSGG